MTRGTVGKTALILALLAVSACAPKRPPSRPTAIRWHTAPAEGAANAYRLKQGEYLSERYMRRLLATASPAVAAEGSGPFCGWVMPLDRCVMCVDIGDFTHGWGCLSLWPDDTVRTANEAYFAGGAPAFHVRDETHFELRLRNMPPIRFSYVGSARGWVGSAVFLGTYRGEQGQECVFGPNGWAILPDGAHPYDLRLDREDLGFDTVDIQGCPYEWVCRGDDLDLYPLREGRNGLPSDRPAFRLRLVKRGAAPGFSIKPADVEVPQRKIIIKSISVASTPKRPERP